MSDQKDIKEYKVGEDIEAFCTFCKMDLSHVIVAKKGDDVRRVKCSTCGREHNYRTPRRLLSKKGAKGGAAGSARERGAAELKQFTLENVTVHPDSIRPYAQDGVYTQGDWINHPKFGFGEVLSMRGPVKMDVRFGNGTKIMICGRKEELPSE